MLTAIFAGAETLTEHSNLGFLFQCNFRTFLNFSAIQDSSHEPRRTAGRTSLVN